MSAAGVMDGMPPGFVSPAAFWFLPQPGRPDGPDTPAVPAPPSPKAKTSGLGDNFYLGGYDLSGDINSLQKISGTVAVLDVTAINESAHERLGGKRDGAMDFTSYFNPTNSHPVLSSLPTADVQASYRRGTALGNPAAEMIAKQLDYNGTRGADGSFTFICGLDADGYGLEWGVQLTPGLRSDSAPTNGPFVDGAAPSSFGAQAYLQVTAFTGTDVTVKIQDSADEVNFADVPGLTFAQTTAALTTQRIATANTATIRRFLRAVTITTGGFTAVTFALTIVRNQIAGVTF
jgi:hypothetical protein